MPVFFEAGLQTLILYIQKKLNSLLWYIFDLFTMCKIYSCQLDLDLQRYHKHIRISYNTPLSVGIPPEQDNGVL